MKLHRTLLGAALVLSLPTAALAGEGFYLGAGAGVNLLRDADINGAGLGILDPDLEFETGFAGALSAGYKFGFGLRPELELSYRRNRMDDVSGAQTLVDGDSRSLSLLANLVYDINTGTAFTPYIGAGAGFSRVWYDNLLTSAGNSVDDSDTVFAYQGIAGVAYSVMPNLDLTLDYRYFATKDPDFTSNLGGFDSEYKNHTVLAGLRYFFGAAPVAAAPAPVPAPAPQVQAQREFLVFFDFDKSAITPVAAKTISDAAATAGATKA
ncbi:MAG TPA: outer membrane beta-barrel protein, partial [Azospirillaceae bacterium]|nr:outer membrane beta-barrel protein [Azospirillaceae bacterium]